MSSAKKLALVIFVLMGCVGCDQTTKLFAQSYLSHSGVQSILGDSIRLQLAYNHGAFLGLGAALPEIWRQAIFNFGIGILLVGLIGYLLISRKLQPIGVVAVALFLAGGISNLADRLFNGGYVVDFINLGFGPLRTGIFNLADLFIMGGAFLLLINGLYRTRKSIEKH